MTRTLPFPDLTNLDLPKLDLPQLDADQVVGVLRDAAYVAIGFGVLGVQQFNVRRRELLQRLPEATTSSIDERLAQLDARLQGLEARIDSAVEAIEAKLPEQAGAIVGQAHDVAKAARTQLRGLVRNAA